MVKIELASQEMCQKYSYQLEVVLGILNHVEALVTDESTVADFLPHDEDMALSRLTELADIFNSEVSLNTKLWELAKMICFDEYEVTDE